MSYYGIEFCISTREKFGDEMRQENVIILFSTTDKDDHSN